MKRRSLFMFLAGAALCLGQTTAFAQEGTPAAMAEDPLGLTTHLWELAEIETASGETATPPDPTRYTVQFSADGDVHVRADCNFSIGTYSVDGEAISIVLGPTTLALCPEDSHSDQFLFSLNGAGSVTLTENGELSVAPAEGASEGAGAFVLRPSLIGTVWSWTQFESSDESVIAPEDPSRYTIEFLDSSSVAIGADCNRGRGNYVRNGAEIDIEITALTRAYCGDESLSDQYIDFLNEAVTLTFRDGQLHLALPMDGGILSFAPLLYEAEDE